MDELILHLGAHKTATTYIQKQLEKNSAYFPNDITYLPLNIVRTNITTHIRSKKNDDFAIMKVKETLEQYKSSNKIIISDENMLGNARLAQKGILYTDLDKSLNRIQKCFSEVNRIKVVFCIRNYSDFLASLYCEYLRHNTYCTIEKYLDDFNIEQSNWLTIYNELSNKFGNENVFLYDFASFDSLEIIDLLTPEEISPIVFPLKKGMGISRPTYSLTFIKLLQKMNELYDEKTTKSILSELEKSKLILELNKGKKFQLKNTVRKDFSQIYKEHYRELFLTGNIVNGSIDEK